MTQQTILLIDAGGRNEDESQKSFGERYWTLMTPGYNWGYKTLPQQQLKGREIDCSRGKGLGGSTAINFCVYTRGPSADYDHWAEIVGDDSWLWQNVQRRFNEACACSLMRIEADAVKIECFHHPSSDFEPFVKVSASAHGSNGQVD